MCSVENLEIVNCPKCSREMINCTDDSGECRYEISNKFNCISVHCDGETCFYCLDCRIVCVLHTDCGTFCKFVGYDYVEDEDLYRPNNLNEVDSYYFHTETIEKYEQIFCECMSNEEIKKQWDLLKDETSECPFRIERYVGDMNLYHFEMNDCPTGEDGGLCHYWKCMKCFKIMSLSDK